MNSGSILSNADHRPRRPVNRNVSGLSLERFAYRSGQNAALERYRQKQERVKVQHAVRHKQYRKALKDAGYKTQNQSNNRQKFKQVHHVNDVHEEDVSHGVIRDQDTDEVDGLGKEDNVYSVDRETLATSAEDQPANTSNVTEQSLAKKTKSPLMKRDKQYHMFSKAQSDRLQRQESVVQAAQRQQQAIIERRTRQQERRQRTRLLSQRTRKGQPIMQNLVHDILNKLEKKQKQSNNNNNALK